MSSDTPLKVEFTHEPVNPDCEEAEAEIAGLRAQLKIATDALGMIVHQGDGCEVEACRHLKPATIADDALIQMSVVR